ALHATLRAHEAARDDYLWQVELHSVLASMALGRTTGPALPANGRPRFRPAHRLVLLKWTVAAAAVLIAFIGGLYWQRGNAPGPDKGSVASRKDGPSMSGAENSMRVDGEAGLAVQGWLRATVGFA